ncbi:MAG TPA: hypothetical protein VGD54_17700 [Steroidobacteraceae bacterium]
MNTSRKLRWTVVSLVGLVCLASWVSLGVGLFMHFNLRVWTLIVTSAAVSTDIFFWTLAAALGLSVFQARHQLWVAISKPFRGHAFIRNEAKRLCTRR